MIAWILLVVVIALFSVALAIIYPTPKRIYDRLITGYFEQEKYPQYNIFNYFPGAVVVLDQNSKIQCFNRESEEITGYRAYEVLGKNYEAIFRCPAPKIEHLDFQNLAKVSKNIKTKKGQDVLIVEAISILENEKEDPVGMLLSFEQAYSKKSMDSQLVLIQTLSSKLVEYCNIGLLILDKHRNVILANEFFQHVMSFPKDEIVGKHIKEISTTIDEHISQLPDDADNVELEEVKLISKYHKTILVDLEFVVQKTNDVIEGYGVSVVFNRVKYRSSMVSTDAPEDENNEMELTLNYFKVKDFIKQMYYKLQDLVDQKKLKMTSTLMKSDSALYADKGKIERVIIFLSGRILQATGSSEFHISFNQRPSGDSIEITVENKDVQVPDKKREMLEKIFENGNNTAQRIINQHQGRLWMELEQGLVFKFTIPFASKMKYSGLKN